MSTSRSLEKRAQDAERQALAVKDRNSAFEASVKSAELYMQALQLSQNASDRVRLDAKCKEVLDRGEKLKSQTLTVRREQGTVSTDHEAGQAGSDPKPPISERILTTREKIILVEGTKLNGFKFPIWDEEPNPDEFILKAGEERFVDLPRLPLSPFQLESFAGWKRAKEALAGKEVVDNGERMPVALTTARAGKVDLVQDMTSDCSVVASLCAGTARAERGHPKILASVIHPYDQEKRLPGMSPSGRYVLRLYFNGCFRKVEIDDFLPTSKDGRVLHVLDRSNPESYWPALLEKAYLKVRSGYDFPGSNSGTDIAVITGWIPEQIFLHDEDVMPDDLWTRIFGAFNRGEVLLTIGTGELPRREQKQIGLAAEHDYAILNIRERSGARELLIKNPWLNGEVWKGAARRRPNPGHEAETDDDVPVALDGDNSEDMIPGTFWMDFGHIFHYFENLYLNWQPGLFKCRQDLHLSWDLMAQTNAQSSFETNPQCSITSTDEVDIWLLLNRHFRTGDYTSHERHANGFISLYLFHKAGHRVFLCDGAKVRGPYVDSPNTLIKFRMPSRTAYTIVVASQNLQAAKHNFTLSAFSNKPVEIAHATSRYTHIDKKHGAWTRSTTGGNSEAPSYLLNPQYSFSLPTTTSIALTLNVEGGTAEDQAEVHVKLLIIFTKGGRVTRLKPRETVASSGDYRRSSAAVETTIEKGFYTIICSTFEPGQLAKFSLTLYTASSNPVSLQPLPPEGSGRLHTMSAAAMFASDTTRVLAPLSIAQLTRATFILRQTTDTKSIALFKMTLEQGQGPYKRILVSSDSDGDSDFSEVSAGVRIDNFDLAPEMTRGHQGGLWLVIERMAGSSSALQHAETVQVECLSEERVDLGQWGIGEG